MGRFGMNVLGPLVLRFYHVGYYGRGLAGISPRIETRPLVPGEPDSRQSQPISWFRQ